jgi:glycosyltransferase involved in cell wall biosynthesis
MKISGFSFVRNGVKFDYPFLESITSLLPLCDELIIAVGKSDDDTLGRIRSLGSPKIRIIETVWDEKLRTGGRVLAEQTDIALNHTTGDWAFYLQADEVLHEADRPAIREAMVRYLDDPRVEGLLFDYRHFYGSYDYVGSSRQWYRREIRVVRNGIGARSWGDAQGFRIDGRKLRVKAIDAAVYHYGWVKPPEVQMAKQRSFHRLWHPDEWIRERLGESTSFDYAEGSKLEKFTGSHPAAMHDRIRSADWKFEYDPSRVKVTFKGALLEWIESTTGVRIGEYKNYELI